MPQTHITPPLIEFKGTTLPVVTVSLRSLQLGELGEAANAACSVTIRFSMAMRRCSTCHRPAQCRRRNGSSAERAVQNPRPECDGCTRRQRGASPERPHFAGLPTYAAVDRSARACHALMRSVQSHRQPACPANGDSSPPPAPPGSGRKRNPSPASQHACKHQGRQRCSSPGPCVPGNRSMPVAAT
jgi:hypothetical protein